MQEKMVTLLVLAIVCLATAVLAGCIGDKDGIPPTPEPTPSVPGEVYFFNQTNNGETYDVPLDAEIQLRLPENPTTGFTWQLSVTPGLVIENESYQPDDPDSRLVGAGGTHLWILRGVQPGMQTITGIYARPWESATGNQSGFSLNLRLSESPPSTGGVPPYMVYTEADNGTTVRQDVGSEFGIRLVENPTTGYSWNLTVPEGLSLIHDEYIPAHPSGQMAGSGGIHSFSFRTTEKGDHAIHGEYRRPWVPAGSVTFVDLEGGFYGIIGDDGERYLPLNLAPDYEVDGLRIAFDYEPVKDTSTIQMWGIPVNITFIEKTDLYDLVIRAG